jgi:hypothetical protein
VANVVTDLNEEDQSEANAELIADVFNQIDDLIMNGELKVSETVSSSLRELGTPTATLLWNARPDAHRSIMHEYHYR